jgi:hypothetical protein
MKTFRLTVDQFTRLLQVMLADETPDELSDLVLLKCSRPHDGIIAIPVHDEAGSAIVAVVQAWSQWDPTLVEVANLMAGQLFA